jgi:hypothetical protein
MKRHLHGVIPCFRKPKILYSTFPVTFSFQETRWRQMAQRIKCTNRGRLIITVGAGSRLRPFDGRRQCAARHSL